jgi:hypothetical protein
MRQWDDSDVPPLVKCARCGRADCGGCSAPSSETAPEEPTLPWETASGSLHQRLWRTAHVTSVLPARTFGELTDGRLGPPFAFALLAETVALGSLAAVGALGGFLLAPDLWLRFSQSPTVVLACAGFVLGAAALMVALHALWGICLELGAGSAAGSFKLRHGMRFGLYACGWDLLTSPAGVLEGILSRGPRRAWGPIAAAVRVPMPAMRAYFALCRQLDPEAQRRAERFNVLVFGGSLAMFALLGATLIVWLLL